MTGDDSEQVPSLVHALASRAAASPGEGADTAARRRLERKARRQDAHRQAILDAAREVLSETGLAGFTVAAVARRAQMTKPRVYYYVASRDELLWLMVLDAIERASEAELAAIEACADSDGPGALEAMMRARVAHYREVDPDGFRLVWIWSQALPAPSPELLEHVYGCSHEVMDALERRLLVSQRAGELHDEVNPRRLANVAFLAVHGILSMFAQLEAAGGAMAHSLEDLVEEAIATVLRGASVA